MPEKANLIIQRQRMGDLILSFPLFSWMTQGKAARPLWVVAEPQFFQALMPLAPSCVFFPPEAEENLKYVDFHNVINLSHRPEAARLAGKLKAERHVGLVERNGISRVLGKWQLYRASLVHNNRHNLMHWADLNALDVIRPAVLQRSAWPERRMPSGNGKIGLFVGASEADKRPDPLFWGELANDLVRRGYKPVFLGGKAEGALAAEAARIAGLPHSNLAGNFSLQELVEFLRGLDLLITPDTGPMHVASWGGTLCLNLSMGPVNAWETAPFPPGHLVLRSSASCTGCWRCSRQNIPCKNAFVPRRIAALVNALLRHGLEKLPVLPGLQLLQTHRSAQGLFQLEPVQGEHNRDNMPLSADWRASRQAARYTVGNFWRQWFLDRLGGPVAELDKAIEDLGAVNPRALAILRKSLVTAQTGMSLAIRRKELPQNYWESSPPIIRPLTGFLQMSLENADFQKEVWLEAIAHLEHLAFCLAK